MSIVPKIIPLFICTLVFGPLCCTGLKDSCKSQDPQIRDLCDQELEINSTNWYLNLRVFDVNEVIQNAVKTVEKKYHSEDVLSDVSGFINGSLNHGQLIDSRPSKDGFSEYQRANLILEVTRNLKDTYCIKHGLSDIKCAKDLTKVKLSKTTLSDTCLSEYYNKTLCIGKNLDYRSPDGSCNNLNRPSLGKSTSSYKRLLFPNYTDGIYNMSEKLPNPRSLSTNLVKDENLTDPLKTMMMAYWTIFIGHDLSQTVLSTLGNTNLTVNCCHKESNIQYALNKNIEFCKPILIPDEDKVSKEEPQPCMNYVRSRLAMRSDCTFGPIEQMNQASHYLDASMIYGTTEQRALSLRKMKDGELSMEQIDITNLYMNYHYLLYTHDDIPEPYRYNKDLTLMLLETNETNDCQHGNGTCFRAGDIRSNAFPQLIVIHTIFMKEHNRICKELLRHNPQWKDEQIFQEAKKIITGYIQHITYNEWLPALLGVNYTKDNGLGLLEKGYSDAYNETNDPSVSNCFATAILPFANSMLSDNISLYLEDRVINGSISLKECYNRPTRPLTNHINGLTRGLITQNSQKVDMLFTQTITNYLYSNGTNNSFGMDMFSLDIQRSRDHGIPSYTQFRKYCGLKDIENEQDLSEIMMEGLADKLLKQYQTWNDIDLLVGALSEKHADDAMVGPTMRCIIREQFVRTRNADRYFYDLPGVFTERQLTEIRKITFARIVCENSNNVTMVQKQAFLTPGSTNELQRCEDEVIPKIFLSRWADMAVTIP